MFDKNVKNRKCSNECIPPVTLNCVPISNCLHPSSANYLNACTYVAGYLLFKASIVCDTCRSVLTLENVPYGNYKYTLIREKQ